MKKLNLLIFPIILIILWYFISLLGLVNSLFLPNPVDAFAKFIKLLFTGDVLPDIYATLFRTLSGFFIAALIGIPLGLLMGYFKKVYIALEFLVDFLRSTSPAALFPLFLLFFGIGDAAKISVVVFSCSSVIIVNTMYGVKHVKESRIIMAKTMRATRYQIIKKIIIPDSLPHIFSGLRIALSLSVIVVVFTEMFIGTTYGLGHRIIDAQLVYKIPELYALIIITGILGYILNKGFLYFENKTIHWGGK